MGSPEVPSSPLAARDIEAEKRQFAGRNLDTLVKRLAERLQEQPDNLDGWVLLGCKPRLPCDKAESRTGVRYCLPA